MRATTKLMKAVAAAAVILGAGLLTGCTQTDAEVASENLSTAADQFEIDRRIVFYNGITDGWMLSIEGRCSIEVDTADVQLEVTCKTGKSEFKKHFLGLSDNVTYFVEQLSSAKVSTYRYRVIFKPSTIVPDVDVDLGGK
jgi:hypothetical protein